MKIANRDEWLIISISGVTCGGKTTLADQLVKRLTGMSVSTAVIQQDQYFFPEDSPKHVLIPDLNHYNHDILNSLDMQKMFRDITAKIESKKCDLRSSAQSTTKNVLIIEGFLVLNYEPIHAISDLKYQILLTNEQCWSRRCNRNYNRPEVKGYFEFCVWPEFLKHNAELKKKYNDIVFLDGTRQDLPEQVIADIEMVKFKVN